MNERLRVKIMKTNMKIKTIVAVMALSAAALLASAQDDGQNGPPPGGGGDQGGPPPGDGGGLGGGFGGRPHHPIPAIVRALDVNHDGIIDSNEIANASAELLTLDKNGDGQLTIDEYMGRPPGPPRGGGDAGGPPDGPPPGDENTNAPAGGGMDGHRHHPPFPAIVRALDVNHDGIIDSNEIANASVELLTLDKNHDGQLTRDEYMGRPPGRRGGDDGMGGPPPDDGNGGPPPQQ